MYIWLCIKSKKIKIEDVEKITGAPKTTLVNEYISAIAEMNIEKGISAVKKAASENLDMKLYFKLIIEKFRIAIILRYAPKLESEMVGDLGEADLEFLKSLVKTDKDGMLRSGALSILSRQKIFFFSNMAGIRTCKCHLQTKWVPV